MTSAQISMWLHERAMQTRDEFDVRADRETFVASHARYKAFQEAIKYIYDTTQRELESNVKHITKGSSIASCAVCGSRTRQSADRGVD